MSDRTYPHSQTPQTNTCSNTLPSSRYITSAASSHGTIRTDNQQLLSLLRDNSQDRIQEPTQKAEASGAVVNPNDSNRNLTNPSNPVVTDRDSQVDITNIPSGTERLVDIISPHKSLLHASNPPRSPVSSASTKNSSSRLNSARPFSNLSQVESNNFDRSLLIDSLEAENRTAHAPAVTAKPSGGAKQVPPLDLNHVDNSQAFDSLVNTANTAAQDQGQISATLTSTSENPEALHTGGYLHALATQSEAQKDLHVSSPHDLNQSARSHVRESPALSVSVVSQGEGKSETKRDVHSVNSTEQEKYISKIESNNSDEFIEDPDTFRSARLNPNLSTVAPTPGHSAPITGRQTYAVPSPISDEVPIIDSLNFSARENTADGVPLPTKANSSPRPSAKQRTSRDPSATQRSTSSVYTVVNPAIQAVQGTSAKSQRSFRDSLEQSNANIDTNEINEIPYSERRLKSNERKSAVSFKEPETQAKERENPEAKAESPINIAPDWETPRVEDRVPTPHPSSPPKSPAKDRSTPTREPLENEVTGQVRNKSPERLKSPEKTPERRVSPTPYGQRPTSVKSDRKSPLPVEQEERNLESASIPQVSRGNTENRTVRTDSLPTVKRVYVDSPTFTKEEEEEYRFVESRLGEIQDDVEETLRRLDKESEKQRNIRKKLERQMATMYAPAYQDQPNGQSYGGAGYNQPHMNRNREDPNRGAYTDNYREEAYGDQRRDNMGSYGNIRAMNDNPSYGEPQRDNMGSYATLRNDDRISYSENRQDNMGSHRREVDPRYDDMGSYGRRDVDRRQDNMATYGNNPTFRRDNDQRQDNMGSNPNFRRDYDQRQDNMGSNPNFRREYEQRQDNMGSNPNFRREYEQRQDNMGSNSNFRRDNEQGGGYMGSYADVRRVEDQYGQSYSPDKGDLRRGNDRYEDRDSRLNRYEDRNQLEYGAPRPHVMNGGYETHDDELKREFEYQQSLKNRIEESGRRDNEVQIPRLPMNSESFRDSLDEEGYGEWRNPPPNPYAQEQGRVSEGGMQQERGGYRDERQEEEAVPDFVDRNDTDRMEILHPREPTYDFVENNKYDYGKPPERSYRELKHIKEEEEKKLDHYFVHPKPVPKKNRHAGKGLLKSAPMKLQQTQSPVVIEEVDPNSPAQALWAKRSAALKRRDSDKKSMKKTKPLQRFDSDTRIMRPPPPYLSGTAHNHQSAVTYGTPTHFNNDNRIAIRPSHLSQGTAHNHTSAVNAHHLEPLHNHRKARSEPPNYPDQHSPQFRKPHELKPITQEIVTDDGQRISVDINLKVVSPPPSGGLPTVHAEVTPNRRPTGQQYQLEDGGDTNQQSQNQDPTQNQYDHHGNQENVAPENTAPSGYHAHSYRDFSPTNPYPKIPPIPITEDELERQIADMEGDGYAAMYRREKEKPKDAVPWYKIYNLQDYKRMQLEARLTRGPLGPDLDNETYKEKLEKRQKQFDYARMVMERNRMELDGKQPKPKPKKNELENSKRKAAIDYSKNVPKPVVKPRPNQYNSYDVAAQLSPVSKPNKSAPTTTSQSPAQTVDVIDIQKLQQRHEQEKQNVAMIRQNMETVPQKA